MATKYDDDVISIPEKKLSGGMTGAFQRQIASANEATRARTSRFERGIPEPKINRSRVTSPRLAEIGQGNQETSVKAFPGSSMTNSFGGMVSRIENNRPVKQSTGVRNITRDQRAVNRLNAFDKDLAVSGKLQRIGGYDVSGMTSGELKRFSRQPTDPTGKTRMVRTGRPEGGWSPDYGRRALANLSRRERMPRFDAPGFTGRAKKARIHSQKQQWLKRQEKREQGTKLARIKQSAIRDNLASTAQNQARLNQGKEAGINRRFGAAQAYQKMKDALAREDKLAQGLKKNYEFVADIDPITGKKLSTGKFYDPATAEWKNSSPASQDVEQDAASAFRNKYKPQN